MEAREVTMMLDDSEEVIASIVKALEEHRVRKCSFSSVSGKITDFDLRFLQGGLLQKKHLDEPYRIVNISGDARLREGKGYDVHLIIGAANLSGTRQVSGEIEKGFASGELTIRAKILESL